MKHSCKQLITDGGLKCHMVISKGVLVGGRGGGSSSAGEGQLNLHEAGLGVTEDGLGIGVLTITLV
jgi:hypothetical protein